MNHKDTTNHYGTHNTHGGSPNSAYAYRAEGRPAPPAPAPQSYDTRKRRGRAKRGFRRFIVMLLALAVMMGAAFSLVYIFERRDLRTRPEPSPAANPVLPQALPPIEPAPPPAPEPEAPAIDNTGWNTETPVEGGGVVPLTTPSSQMLALPENGRIDLSYFDTAVFVGDSITQGLQIYTQGLPNASYCAYKGISPKQIYDGSIQTLLNGTREVPMEALAAHQPDNVYVLLGTNAMVGMADEPLLAYYSEMLDAMRAALHAEVDIYVQSITPVLPGFEHRFNNERIAGLNDALAQMAWEKGMYFLDLHEALNRGDGYMRADFGAPSDGFHMRPAGYAAWVEYLVTHTAYNRRHAHLYQEGEHFYAQTPQPEEGAA